MTVSPTNVAQVMRDRAYNYLFNWVLFIGVVCVGAVILWDYGFLAYVFAGDVSRISSVIIALFVVMSAHCLYLLTGLSSELRTLERATGALESGGRLRFEGGRLQAGSHLLPERSAVTGYVSDVLRLREQNGPGGRDMLSQILAARLRAQARLGIMMSDVLYKLGLLGTVVGFILMLSSMGDLGEFEVETMRDALQAMTSGMAISLLTTITGLVCGTLLRMEYTFVEGLTSAILQRAVRMTEMHLVSVPAPKADDV